MRVRRACCAVDLAGALVGELSRGCQSIDSPALPATISAAFGVSRWQWMSIVNHLPRACAGPGKRPGICAPWRQACEQHPFFSCRFVHPSGRLRAARGCWPNRRGVAI